jgi:DNA-binding NtrC family response regulator
MSARKILLVDDDAIFSTQVQNTLGRAFTVTHAASEVEFRARFRPFTFDLIILDMRLDSEREGLGLLREISAYDELQPVIMVSAYGDTDAVLDAAEAGALMFLHKQEFTPELLTRMVEAILQQSRIRRHLAALQQRIEHDEIAGLTSTNSAVRRAGELAQQAADDRECTVLVSGEEGAGHELMGQVVHDRSRWRCEAPYVKACGMPSCLADPRTALFGAPPRGATPRRKGMLEQANGGVLFLGNLEALETDVRESLAAVLRRRTLDFGSAEPPVPLDLQLVTGTCTDEARSMANALRDSVAGVRLVEIYLPPVRERREDIPVLATLYLQELRRNGKTTARSLSRDALAILEGHAWPGNLPELHNAVEFGAIKALADGSEEVAREHLPANLFQTTEANGHRSGRWDYRYHLARTEVALANRALQEKGPVNKTQLAALLGYTDRFAFSRRVRKALEEFPDIARDFSQVSGMFRIVD